MSGAPDGMRVLVEPVEPLAPERQNRHASDGLDELSFGPGVWSVDLETETLTASPSRPRDASARTRLRFEEIRLERRPALLMLTPPSLSLRVNGLPAPRPAVLEVGDQILTDRAVLHVSRYRSPALGAPPAALVGRECPVCRTAVAADSRVLVHECGEPIHLEPESVPEERRLECASLGDCPSCNAPVGLEEGLVWMPDQPEGA